MSATKGSDYFARTYGDLLYDLCVSLLRNSGEAQLVLRSLLKKMTIQSKNKKNAYTKYERAWILRMACEKLIHLYKQSDFQIPPEEQIKLDSNESVSIRLKQFESYFHRLVPEDQLLFLLKEKWKIPDTEIAMALAIPEGSLKIQRLQALRTLEEWIWTNHSKSH